MKPPARNILFWLAIFSLVGVTAVSCGLCRDVRRHWPLILLISLAQAAVFIFIRLKGMSLAWTTAAYDAAIIAGWYGALFYLGEGGGRAAKFGLLLVAAGLFVLSVCD
jgi:hypothetical protein